MPRAGPASPLPAARNRSRAALPRQKPQLRIGGAHAGVGEAKFTPHDVGSRHERYQLGAGDCSWQTLPTEAAIGRDCPPRGMSPATCRLKTRVIVCRHLSAVKPDSTFGVYVRRCTWQIAYGFRFLTLAVRIAFPPSRSYDGAIPTVAASRNLSRSGEDSVEELGDPIGLIAFLLLGLILALFLYSIRDWWRSDSQQRWKLSLDSRTHVPFSGLVSALRRCWRRKRR